MTREVHHKLSGSLTVSTHSPLSLCHIRHHAEVVVGGVAASPYPGDTIMIFFGILASIAAIGTFYWLLFTLAVFALPFFAGVHAGIWAYHTGAGRLGALVVGFVATGLVFGIGQMLLVFVRPTWARLLVAAVFIVPAAIAVTSPPTGSSGSLCHRRPGRPSFPASAPSRWGSRRSCGLRG
jgi:hypothetical protein